jgi:hypothetical protein
LVQVISFHYHRAVLAAMGAEESDDEAVIYPSPPSTLTPTPTTVTHITTPTFTLPPHHHHHHQHRHHHHAPDGARPTARPRWICFVNRAALLPIPLLVGKATHATTADDGGVHGQTVFC